MTEDKIVRWHHLLDGHEFEKVLVVCDGEGSLVCCSPWGHKESDTTEWLNNNRKPNSRAYHGDSNPFLLAFQRGRRDSELSMEIYELLNIS